MKRILIILGVSLLFSQTHAQESSEAVALRILNEWMRAFNEVKAEYQSRRRDIYYGGP